MHGRLRDFFWTHSAHDKNLNDLAERKDYDGVLEEINPNELEDDKEGQNKANRYRREQYIKDFYNIYTGQSL